MVERVRIGFVGVGVMGQSAHLRNYASLPDCEVVAIAELRENQGRNVAQRYGVPNVYRTHDEMLSAQKLDGIVASQQFTRHGILVPELLKAGVPIFTEKPLAGSIEAGERILRAVKESGTWLMVGYHKRSDPAIMYAKAEIDRLKESGELGKMRYVRITMPAGDWVANGFFDHISSEDPDPQLESDPPATDMSPELSQRYIDFVNYYIHQANLLRHLFGEDYQVTYADPAGVLFAAESDGGMTGIVEMTPYQTTLDWQESALVAFERGFIRINLPAPMAINRPGTVEIYRDPSNGVIPQTIVPQLPWVHAMRQQAMNFIAAIKGEMPPMCGAADALKDLQSARDYIRLLTGS